MVLLVNSSKNSRNENLQIHTRYSGICRKENTLYSFGEYNLNAKTQQGQCKKEKVYIILNHKYKCRSPKYILENLAQQCINDNT